MRTIPLGKGMVALIDDSDYESVSKFSWRAIKPSKKSGIYYAYSSKAKTYMHRFLLGAGPGQRGDHKNGDGLDNRRYNLRLATHQQNQCNQRTQSRSKSSRYKGVCYSTNTKGRPWFASTKFMGRKVNIGCFATEEEAARAYDAKARELFGEFAKPNFE